MSAITVTVDRNDNRPITPPDTGFIYVDQGNYQTLQLSDVPFTIYSDSATSCIITIVVATSDDSSTVTLAHLDSEDCIKAFFEIVTAQGAVSYQIFAQGANPHGDDTATANATQLKDSIQALGSAVASQQLFLLEGDPQQYNRGNFGLAYHGDGTATATNQPYTLALYQRDPTCGGQTVYCIMRRQENPPVQLRDAGVPFTHAELVELSFIAIKYSKKVNNTSIAFTDIINQPNDEIPQFWSTTPDFEAPWFSDQLKQGAAFAIAMAPVVIMSEQHLKNSTISSFARMRKSLIE